MRTSVSILFLFLSLWVVGCATAPRPKAEKIPRAAPELNASERIEEALAKYRSIQERGGWPQIPSGPKLQVGDQDERVALLRRRLAATGDLKVAKSSSKKGDGEGETVFDEPLVETLQRFQERHGLEPDGTLGPETLKALNVSVEERIRQMEINLERLRTLPDLGKRYVVVNIPDFRLKVIDGREAVLTMNVVIGQRREWQTPLLDSEITYLILNPKWNVPPDIFKKEVLRHIQKDVNYLAKENMVVVSTDGPVDPTTIDWSQVDPKAPKYRIVQREGPGNSLGRIKFMFPNRYAVYLHDTPQKKLFARRMRALSHGCVRVERPMDLAEYLMRENSEWTRDRIESAIRTGKNRTVPLPESVKLHIVYFTSWIDRDGTVHFRDDVYGLDQGLPQQVSLGSS